MPNFLRERKFNELTESLVRDASPSRVWSHYTSLLNTLGYEKLPLEVHQQVLRRCTAPSAELRATSSRVVKGATSPHLHEGRFQTVIRNIRALDMKPTLDDYHFILEQFAAVGHHVGVMYVYGELTHLGLRPRTKTFGLCLQAIAHRLTLPLPKADHPKLTSQTRRMIADLMANMQRHSIPFTSVNLDLTIRILKETSDTEGFELLMKMGYGIDLSNPDRLPLDFLQPGTISSDLGMGEPIKADLPAPQPFSTSALNTTIDTLGRLGNISKLVQAFEVLTEPLPTTNQYLPTSFDDEDDFGVADGPTSIAYTPPHASANITTYNMLLRHLCKAGHTTLARHYLNQAMWLDRETEKLTKLSIRGNRRMYAPHFAINRGTLLPAFGESNRDKDVGLMRWLATKVPRIIKHKKKGLAFWERYRDHAAHKVARQIQRSSAKAGVPQMTQTSLRPSSSEDEPAKRSSWSPTGIFDLDMDAPPTPPAPPPPQKHFDVDLHILILQRDIIEIEKFATQVEDILGRTTQRLKERLGRRVWAGKDIYLTTGEGRQKLSRQRWREIVQFQPRNTGSQFSRSFPPPLRETLRHDKRGFSTSSHSSDRNSGMSDLEFNPSPTSLLDRISSIFHRR
jgi:pentatricopeptide repeat protein